MTVLNIRCNVNAPMLDKNCSDENHSFSDENRFWKKKNASEFP